MARQLRRRSESGFTRVDVISAIAVIPILAVLSVPSFQNVTEAYKHRDALRQVKKLQAADSAAKQCQETAHPSPAAANNLLTKDCGQ